MGNPFKRNQAITYAIKGRTGNTTRGGGTFKAMGERGRCTIKAENGKELSVYISNVTAADAATSTNKASRTTGKAAPAPARPAARKAASAATKPTARKANRPSKPGIAASQLAELHGKLDAILAILHGNVRHEPVDADDAAIAAVG